MAVDEESGDQVEEGEGERVLACGCLVVAEHALECRGHPHACCSVLKGGLLRGVGGDKVCVLEVPPNELRDGDGKGGDAAEGGGEEAEGGVGGAPADGKDGLDVVEKVERGGGPVEGGDKGGGDLWVKEGVEGRAVFEECGEEAEDGGDARVVDGVPACVCDLGGKLVEDGVEHAPGRVGAVKLDDHGECVRVEVRVWRVGEDAAVCPGGEGDAVLFKGDVCLELVDLVFRVYKKNDRAVDIQQECDGGDL